MSIKDYFSFTRSEKRGAFVLLLIIILLIGFHFIVDFFEVHEQTDFSSFEKDIAKLERELSNQNIKNKPIEYFKFNPNTASNEEWKKLGFKDWQIKNINKYKKKGGFWKTKKDVSKIYGLKTEHYNALLPYIILPEKENQKKIKTKSSEPIYFEFDPNTISKDDWEKLGFSNWQVRSIFNYKAKGGKWDTKSDVKKIYRLSEEEYNKLKPYILLPDKASKNSIKNNNLININKANAKAFTKLKGIHSEKYGSTIVNYRKKLGGFVSKEQLKEVWGMKEETYQKFEHQIELTDETPQQLNINLLSAEELKNHPYINWKLANAIVKYRKSNGNYQSTLDLKKIHLVSDEIYLKIEPYLKIE